MVDVLSSFRIRYVVKVESDVRDALDEVVWREGDTTFKEFSQKHIDPTAIIDHREITEEEYLELFDKDNDYLAVWTDEQKKSFINVIEYEPKELDNGA
jgi:NAD-specific glutamate dehydrogenase